MPENITKALILDLGGVILDLDFPKMLEAFAKLGIPDFQQQFNLEKQGQIFQKQELGQLPDAEFFAAIRQLSSQNPTDAQITAAWCDMLTDFKPERLKVLEKLSQTFDLYLFSNTNALHAKHFEANCLKIAGQPIGHYFKQVFYSHELQLRKPTVEAFQAVLDLAKLEPASTLFIDDNAANIAGAQQAGLKTYHLQAPETLEQLDFSKWS